MPGSGPSETQLRQVMKTRKTKTTLIEDGSVVSIADFLKALVDKKVQAGDLLMGAHASLTISRQDYGVGKSTPMIGNEIKIELYVEARQAPPAPAPGK